MRMIKDALQKPEINFWIGLIIPLVAIAVAWGVNNTRLSNLENWFDFFGGRYEERVKQVDTKMDAQDVAFTQIQVRLAEIQKDISFIRDQVK